MYKKVKIPSLPENLRVIENLIDEVSTNHAFDSDFYGKILVASVEAVNNSIIHGNKLNPEKFVEVIVKTSENEFIVKVEDEGPGFDYRNIPDPTAPENIEKINGRGVFLMEHLSDKMSFNDTGSGVEMIFNLI